MDDGGGGGEIRMATWAYFLFIYLFIPPPPPFTGWFSLLHQKGAERVLSSPSVVLLSSGEE